MSDGIVLSTYRAEDPYRAPAEVHIPEQYAEWTKEEEEKHPRDEEGQWALKDTPVQSKTKIESLEGKQQALFSTSGLPGQINLFADAGVPDEWVQKSEPQPSDSPERRRAVFDSPENTRGKPAYDDDYDGPRWSYGFTNRPPGLAHNPRGMIIGSDRPHDKFNFGTVDYPFPLTQEEMYGFELHSVYRPGQIVEIPSTSIGRGGRVKVLAIEGGRAIVGYDDTPLDDRSKWNSVNTANMPEESLQQFFNDLSGVVDIRPSDDPELEAIRTGQATLLGKGDDGVAFGVGDKVVKMSTTVPYHPISQQTHRTPDEAIDMLSEDYATAKLLRKAGVPGILDQQIQTAKGRGRSGDKAFLVMNRLDVQSPLTLDHLNQIRASIKAMHEIGWTVNDQIQVGIGKDGNAYQFDLGKASKAQFKTAKEDDISSLSMLHHDNNQELIPWGEQAESDFDGWTWHAEKWTPDKTLDAIAKWADIGNRGRKGILEDHPERSKELNSQFAAQLKSVKLNSSDYLNDEKLPGPRTQKTLFSRLQSPERYTEWDESKHPRGQLENPGQFVTKGNIVRKIDNEHVGHHHGQHDFVMSARDANGDVVGRITYALIDDDIYIQHVHVPEEHRRKGIATAMYERVLSDHPDATLAKSMVTPEGAAFRSSIEQRLSDRLKPTAEPQPRPEPISDDDWGIVYESARIHKNTPAERSLYDLMNRMNDHDREVMEWNQGEEHPEPIRVHEELNHILQRQAGPQSSYPKRYRQVDPNPQIPSLGGTKQESSAEHTPGETITHNGKTYVLNENHRWTGPVGEQREEGPRHDFHDAITEMTQLPYNTSMAFDEDGTVHYHGIENSVAHAIERHRNINPWDRRSDTELRGMAEQRAAGQHVQGKAHLEHSAGGAMLLARHNGVAMFAPSDLRQASEWSQRTVAMISPEHDEEIVIATSPDGRWPEWKDTSSYDEQDEWLRDNGIKVERRPIDELSHVIDQYRQRETEESFPWESGEEVETGKLATTQEYWTQAPEAIPRSEHAIRRAIKDAVGDDPLQQREFRKVLDQVYDSRVTDIHSRNAAFRELLGNFGIESNRIGAFVMAARRAKDADSLMKDTQIGRRFDQMVEYAQDHTPELLQYESGESVKPGDEESALFARMQSGLEDVPDPWSDEIVSATWEYIDAAGGWYGEPKEEGGPSEEEHEQRERELAAVPFSRQDAKIKYVRWCAANLDRWRRYGMTAVAPEDYALKQPQSSPGQRSLFKPEPWMTGKRSRWRAELHPRSPGGKFKEVLKGGEEGYEHLPLFSGTEQQYAAGVKSMPGQRMFEFESPTDPGFEQQHPRGPGGLWVEKPTQEPAQSTEQHANENIVARFKGGDRSAANDLIEANRGLIFSVARRYGRQPADIDDLYQEGAIGLMRAAEKFNPEKGLAFGTYAYYWVNSAVSRGAKRLYPKGATQPEEELNLEDVAVDPSTLQSADRAARTEFLQNLESAMDVLPERERDAVTLRFGLGDEPPQRWEDVGEQLGVSHQRAQQIVSRAVGRLKASLEPVSYSRAVRESVIRYLKERYPDWYARKRKASPGQLSLFGEFEETHPRAKDKVDILGVEYDPGEWIPKDVALMATPEEKEKIEDTPPTITTPSPEQQAQTAIDAIASEWSIGQGISQDQKERMQAAVRRIADEHGVNSNELWNEVFWQPEGMTEDISETQYPDLPVTKPEDQPTKTVDESTETVWALDEAEPDWRPEWFHGQTFPGIHSKWKAIVTKNTNGTYVVGAKRRDGKAKPLLFAADTPKEAFVALRTAGGWWRQNDPKINEIVKAGRRREDLTSARTDRPLHELTLAEFKDMSRFTPSRRDLHVYDPHGRKWLHPGNRDTDKAAQVLHGNAIKSALAAGTVVSEKILVDYPELQQATKHQKLRCFVLRYLKDRYPIWYARKRKSMPGQLPLFGEESRAEHVPGETITRGGKTYVLSQSHRWTGPIEEERETVSEAQSESKPDWSTPEGRRQIIHKTEDELRESRDREKCVAWAPDGTVIHEDAGESNRIFIPVEVGRKLRGATFTHNHPTGFQYTSNDPRSAGYSFSNEDILLAVASELREIRAVSPGYRHSLVIPKDFIGKTYRTLSPPVKEQFNQGVASGRYDTGGHGIADLVVKYTIAHVEASLRSHFQTGIDNAMRDSKQKAEHQARVASSLHHHVKCETLAKMFGWTYKREEYEPWKEMESGSTSHSLAQPTAKSATSAETSSVASTERAAPFRKSSPMKSGTARTTTRSRFRATTESGLRPESYHLNRLVLYYVHARYPDFYAKRMKSTPGQLPLFGEESEAEHTPGETMVKDGKTYVLSEGHRWTGPVEEQAQVPERQARPVSEWTDDDKIADWKQNGVKGQAFKAWFGPWDTEPDNASKVFNRETGEPQETHNIPSTGSLVKDAEGKPIVVYHGTAHGGFEAFDKGKISKESLFGPGFYFTEDKDIAQEYESKEGRRGILLKEPDVVVAEARTRLKRLLKSTEGRLAKVYVENAPEWRKVDDMANYYGDELLLDTLKFDAATGGLNWFETQGESLSDLVGTSSETKAVYLNIHKPFSIEDGRLDFASLPPNAKQDIDHYRQSLTGPKREKQRQYGEQADALRHKADKSLDQLRRIHKVPDELLDRQSRAHGLATGNPDIVAKWEAMDDNAITLLNDYEHVRGLQHAAQQDSNDYAAQIREINNTQGASYYDLDAAFRDRHQINSLLQKAGYDGITHIGGDRMGGGHHHRVWIAFEPNQIKAIDNRGTFDPGDDRIRYAENQSQPSLEYLTQLLWRGNYGGYRDAVMSSDMPDWQKRTLLDRLPRHEGDAVLRYSVMRYVKSRYPMWYQKQLPRLGGTKTTALPDPEFERLHPRGLGGKWMDKPMSAVQPTPRTTRMSPTPRKLSSDAIQSSDPLDGGKNKTIKIAYLDETGNPRHGVFKPVRGENENLTRSGAFPTGTFAVREVAASVVNDAMELHLVPTTTMVELEQHGVGSIQNWFNDDAQLADQVSEDLFATWGEVYFDAVGNPESAANDNIRRAIGYATEHQRHYPKTFHVVQREIDYLKQTLRDRGESDEGEKFPNPFKEIANGDDMLYFDALIGNIDRHDLNWFVKQNHVALIDNGLSFADNQHYIEHPMMNFRDFTNHRENLGIKTMSPDFRQGLDRMLHNKDGVDAKLAETGLTTAERDSFWKRAELIQSLRVLVFNSETHKSIAEEIAKGAA